MDIRAHGWRGTVRGRIDEFGELTGVLDARRSGGWVQSSSGGTGNFSTKYSNGLFEVTFQSNTAFGVPHPEWKITLMAHPQ